MLLARIPELDLLDITTSIVASNACWLIASITGCKDDPLVEPNTPNLIGLLIALKENQ